VIDVRGTEGPDRLGDRIGPTRIEALGGDDFVQGGERADGGPGNDRMLGTGLQLGGPGDDRMDVGAHGLEGGRIAGQDGDDFITGSDGRDSLSAGRVVEARSDPSGGRYEQQVGMVAASRACGGAGCAVARS
jgi:Ca2+-binding RTX toxin-like protein